MFSLKTVDLTRAVTKCDLISPPPSTLTETSILYTDKHTDGHMDRWTERLI